jgi:hypothetical protein
MTFDLLAQQTAILARLALLASPVPIIGTFDRVDLTDESAYPAGAQIQYAKLAPLDQAGKSAKFGAVWTFDLYVDAGRVSSTQQTAAFTLFSAALGQLVGWEINHLNAVQATAGQDTASEGRITRISFGFTIPVYLAG